MTLSKVALPFLAALLVLPATQAADFVDPLDTPSIVSPLATSRLLNGVARAGERLVAVGQRGHIVYSQDEGKSWKQAAVPVSVDLLAVQFPTPTHGWAVGHSGIVLNTEDGGLTWVRQLDGRDVVRLLRKAYVEQTPARFDGDADALATFQEQIRRLAADGPDKPFHDLWFDDEKVGYLVGPFNLILRTADGGKSWQPLLDRTDNPRQLHFFGVRRVGGVLYVAGEQGLVLKLDPADQRFHAVSVAYPGTLFGVTGTPSALLVYGLRGNVFRSLDQGGSWAGVKTGTTAGIVASALMPQGRIQLFSQAGQVLVSDDDGRSFSLAPSPLQPTSNAIVLPDGALLQVGVHGVALRPACMTDLDCS